MPLLEIGMPGPVRETGRFLQRHRRAATAIGTAVVAIGSLTVGVYGFSQLERPPAPTYPTNDRFSGELLIDANTSVRRLHEPNQHWLSVTRPGRFTTEEAVNALSDINCIVREISREPSNENTVLALVFDGNCAKFPTR